MEAIASQKRKKKEGSGEKKEKPISSECFP